MTYGRSDPIITILTQQIEGFDMYTYSDQLYSDFHKDAYGFRPSQDDPFYTADPKSKQIIWDLCTEQYEFKCSQEKLEEARCIANFQDYIDRMIDNGAGDEPTAYRWIVEGENFQNEMDVEHYVWNQGILFTDYGKQIHRILSNILERRNTTTMKPVLPGYEAKRPNP